MRNYRKKNQKTARDPKKNFKYLLLPGIFLAVVFVFQLVGDVVDAKVKPTLHNLADYEAQYAAVQAIRKASTQEMREHEALYQSLYTITYTENGEMQSITSNAAAMNQAKLALTDAVQTTIGQMPTIRKEINYGNLSGSSLYSHWGPHWVMDIEPHGYVEAKFQETVKSIGVNQTEYRMELVLTVTMDLILDSDHSTLPVSDTVLLASAVVTGETPIYYGYRQTS